MDIQVIFVKVSVFYIFLCLYDLFLGNAPGLIFLKHIL